MVKAILPLAEIGCIALLLCPAVYTTTCAGSLAQGAQSTAEERVALSYMLAGCLLLGLGTAY